MCMVRTDGYKLIDEASPPQLFKCSDQSAIVPYHSEDVTCTCTVFGESY